MHYGVLMEGNRPIKFTWVEVCTLYIYFAALFILFIMLPESLWRTLQSRDSFIVLGVIGTWRYSWWMTHFIRALIYEYTSFPARRKASDTLWASGWRPEKICIMMTTYNERQDLTQAVLNGLVSELESVGVPAQLFVGTSGAYDERVIEDHLKNIHITIPFETIFVRQNQPGKRFAIGSVLRAMSRKGIRGDIPVIFLDGDSIIGPDCLRQCLPFFELFPQMNALTTDEIAVIHGPYWIKLWYSMRFAQRHLVMQSHALSRKVMTLTGRMSIFRACHVVDPEFISTVEVDHLYHWIWGEFRFLSGDDKSTWYHMLKRGGELLYVRDALVYTVEYVDGTGFKRMRENLLRWSGNILRNGARAIKLGPSQVGYFIWWCLIDQRIAMWTTICGAVSILIITIFVHPAFIFGAILWIGFSRMTVAVILSRYGGRLSFLSPLIIYFNQFVNAGVKIYLLFRLSKQRWANRGDQSSGFGETSSRERANIIIANSLTGLCFIILIMALMVYEGVINLRFIEISTWLH